MIRQYVKTRYKNISIRYQITPNFQQNMRLTKTAMTPQTFRALVTKAKKTLAAVETLSTVDLPKASTVKQSPGDCDTIVKVRYYAILDYDRSL